MRNRSRMLYDYADIEFCSCNFKRINLIQWSIIIFGVFDSKGKANEYGVSNHDNLVSCVSIQKWLSPLTLSAVALS